MAMEYGRYYQNASSGAMNKEVYEDERKKKKKRPYDVSAIERRLNGMGGPKKKRISY
jgi:hypothetical protein